jgi:hypothetical protein
MVPQTQSFLVLYYRFCAAVPRSIASRCAILRAHCCARNRPRQTEGGQDAVMKAKVCPLCHDGGDSVRWKTACRARPALQSSLSQKRSVNTTRFACLLCPMKEQKQSDLD